MSVLAAEIVCVACGVAGLVVFLFGLRSVGSMRRASSEFDDALRHPGDRAADPVTVTGEAGVPGAPEEVSRKIAERLASGLGGPPLKVTARTEREVRFEPGGPDVRTGLTFGSGEFRLAPAAGGTEVKYTVDLEAMARRFRRWGMGILLFVTLPAVTVLPAMLFLFVARHADPSVRKQSFQSLQMIHGLWPPFLFSFIFRRMKGMIARSIETMLANLRHT
jgi:hypothetical protein